MNFPTKIAEVEQLISIKMNRKRISSLLSVFLFVTVVFADSNEKGIDYYRAGLYDAAKIFFTSQSGQSAKDQAENYYYLGLMAYDTGDANQAALYFDKSVEADPTYPFGLIGQGKIALAKNETKGATDLFKKAANLAKKNASVQTGIADVYFEAGKNELGMEALGKARDINKKYPGIYMVEGDVLAKEGKVGEAAARYENAVVFDPNDKIALLKLARVYKRVNRDLSLNYLDRLIAIDPNYIPAYAEIGDINYSTGYYGKAIDAYEKFISIPGVPVKQKSNYAELLYFTDQHEKSLQLIDEVLKMTQDNLVMHRIQAYNNFKLKNYDLALQQSLNYLSKMPEDEHIYLDYINLAQIYIELKQFAESIPVFLKALAKDETKGADIYRQLTTAYEGVKDYNKALDAYEKYFDLAENVPALQYFYYGRSAYSGASIYMEKIINTTDPAQGAIYMDSLNYFTTKGDRGFSQVIERLPENHMGYLWIANLYSILDSVEHSKTGTIPGKAKPHFEKAIEIMLADNEGGRRNKDIISGYDYIIQYFFVQNDLTTVAEYGKKILELDPENARAKEILDALKVKY